MTTPSSDDTQKPTKGQAMGSSESRGRVAPTSRQDVSMSAPEAKDARGANAGITVVDEREQVPPQLRHAIDLDLLFLDFHDQFRSDAVSATVRLLDLLLDPITCDARIVVLTRAAAAPLGRKLLPAGFLELPRSYIRELLWISEGKVIDAISSGAASTEYLGQLASHPDALRVAQRAVLEGPDVLSDLVKDHQVEAWSWLRDEVVSGRLQRHRKDVVGKYVAIWKKDQRYVDFEVGDDPQLAREAAAHRWMVPEELIAVTLVDPV